ncbi:Tat pathway signal protein [Alphaproteobacteria bacterium KMM 3653]|uniref:Tat pathway signal protein n=1 Tax=Harenicola maris TaxID=2841044 RepID=A0AAP2CT12_9RHOB|nr:Tat pathway signal protein [Harenicola maris]
MILSRRLFLGTVGAAFGARALPVVQGPAGRRILTLVRDKAAGGMRAVERVVYH